MKTFRQNHYCSSSRSNSEPLFFRQLRQFFGSRPMSLSRCARTTSITLLLSVGLLAGGAMIAAAQPNTITFDGAMQGTCGVDTECCQTYTLIVNQSTTEVFLNMIGDGTSDGCIDATCWDNQTSYPGVTFSHPYPGLWYITFSPAPATPDTIAFSMCASMDCWSHFDHINWHSNDVLNSSGKLHIQLCGEGGWNSQCGSCDRVIATDNECFTAVCFEHFSSGPLSEFALHFNPPLRPCNFNGANPDYSQQCPGLPNDTLAWSYGWKWHAENQDPSGDDSTLVFDTINSGYTMYGCDEVCLNIPHCADQENTIVTVTDGGYECLDSGASLATPMKAEMGVQEALPQTGADQNYPNPVDASSGFKTTIPFTTSEQGIAFIRIVNEKGVEVLNDNENVSYAGKHFFYITATDLPAGTYYYQIEFPKGVVIQNKTMLVVK